MLFALALAASLAATPVGAASPSSFTLLAQAEAAQPVHAAVPAEPVLRKSTNLLLIALELAVATGAAYVGVLGGVLINFPLGGLSLPPDQNDILLVGGLPVLFAATGGFLIGLFDLQERSFIGSALTSLLGAALGEALGLGAGYLVGQRLTAGDPGGSLGVAVFIAPAVAAIGAVLLTELLKPGKKVSVSGAVVPVREGQGWALAPGLVGQF